MEVVSIKSLLGILAHRFEFALKALYMKCKKGKIIIIYTSYYKVSTQKFYCLRVPCGSTCRLCLFKNKDLSKWLIGEIRFCHHKNDNCFFFFWFQLFVVVYQAWHVALKRNSIYPWCNKTKFWSSACHLTWNLLMKI